MNIVSRGYRISLNIEEENFANKIIDFVDKLEKEIFEAGALPPDDLQTVLNDLRNNVCKLRDNEFYDEGE